MRAGIALIAAMIWACGVVTALAGTVADVEADSLVIRSQGQAITLELVLSQGVPWRVRLHDTPMRVEVDFEEARFPDDFAAATIDSTAIRRITTGPVRQGLTRLVAEFDTALHVEQAGMRVDRETGKALLSLRLLPVGPEEFASLIERPDPLEPDALTGNAPAPLVVLLDPGHGGRDSGARAGGLKEADVMLNFALELETLLQDTTDFSVHLTRRTDRFVSLEDRIETAARVGADVLVSLHADALLGQQAQGAAVYTLSADARDAADEWLQSSRPGEGMLQSTDLSGQGSDVAAALLELSRRQTSPRSGALAHTLVDAIGAADLLLYKRPEKQGNFVVLRSADIPSVLVELGFLSHKEDRARLGDSAWRGFMARALRDGLLAWSVQDFNQRVLLRQ